MTPDETEKAKAELEAIEEQLRKTQELTYALESVGVMSAHDRRVLLLSERQLEQARVAMTLDLRRAGVL